MQASKNLVTDYASSLYAAGMSGQTVFCPAGTYNFKNFSMVEGTKFIGEGEGKTFFYCSSDSGSVVMGSASIVHSGIAIDGVTFISVQGDGSPLLQPYNTHGTSLSNLKFACPGKIAIDIGGPDSFYTRLSGIEVVAAKIGVQVGANAGLVQDLFLDTMVIGGCTQQGIVFTNASGISAKSVDVISAASNGILFNPGTNQKVVAAFFGKVWADTCGDHGWLIAPSGTGVCRWFTMDSIWGATNNNNKDGISINKNSASSIVGNISISDSFFVNNSGNGVSVMNGNDITLDNVTCSDNARQDNINLYDGLLISPDAVNVNVNGGTYGGSDGFPQNQRYGIKNESPSTKYGERINLTGNTTGKIFDSCLNII